MKSSLREDELWMSLISCFHLVAVGYCVTPGEDHSNDHTTRIYIYISRDRERSMIARFAQSPIDSVRNWDSFLLKKKKGRKKKKKRKRKGGGFFSVITVIFSM